VSEPQTTGEPRARRSLLRNVTVSWRHRRPPTSATTHPDLGPRTSSVRSGPAGARTAHATTATRLTSGFLPVLAVDPSGTG